MKPDDAKLAWNGIFNDTFKNYEGNKEVWDFMQREVIFENDKKPTVSILLSNCLN